MSALFSPEILVGVSPADAAIITDFFNRLDDAMRYYAEVDELPPEIIAPQVILPGLIRLSTTLREAEEESDAAAAQYTPKYAVDGKFRHIKWRALLLRMYPGGRFEEPVVEGNVQGHPDYVFEDKVFEIKTVGGSRWMQMRRQRGLPMHHEQLRAYMRMARLPLGVLVYEHRDTLDVWPFVLREEVR